MHQRKSPWQRGSGVSTKQWTPDDWKKNMAGYVEQSLHVQKQEIKKTKKRNKGRKRAIWMAAKIAQWQMANQVISISVML